MIESAVHNGIPKKGPTGSNRTPRWSPWGDSGGLVKEYATRCKEGVADETNPAAVGGSAAGACRLGLGRHHRQGTRARRVALRGERGPLTRRAGPAGERRLRGLLRRLLPRGGRGSPWRRQRGGVPAGEHRAPLRGSSQRRGRPVRREPDADPEPRRGHGPGLRPGDLHRRRDPLRPYGA